jgi:hypothetical protein
MVPQCQGSSHHALSFAAGLPNFASKDYKGKKDAIEMIILSSHMLHKGRFRDTCATAFRE